MKMNYLFWSVVAGIGLVFSLAIAESLKKSENTQQPVRSSIPVPAEIK